MNIEIANRLVELRKKSGLSQEELASRLGLSRQAVSKWERAEASPDTDNLICLAQLYGVSLDDLLNTEQPVEDIVKETQERTKEEESAKQEEKPKEESKESSSGEQTQDSKKFEDSVHIDKNGIHTSDKDGSTVDIDSNGIHVHDPKDGDTSIDKNGVVCGGVKYDWHSKKHVAESIISGSIAILCTIAFLLMGFLWTDKGAGWAIGWNVFFLVPVFPSLMEAIRKRQFTTFAFPVLVTMVYLTMGMIGSVYGHNFWHPYWVEFLAIPVYYIIFGPIDKAIRRSKRYRIYQENEGNFFDFSSGGIDEKIRLAKEKADRKNQKASNLKAKKTILQAKLESAQQDLELANKLPDSYENKSDAIDAAQDKIDGLNESIEDIEDDIAEAEAEAKAAENAYQILLDMKMNKEKKEDKVVDVDAVDK